MTSRAAAVMKTVAAIAVWSGVATPGWAVTATATFNVTVNVIQKCRLSATDLVFGAYDPLAVNLSTALNAPGPGTLVVTCTKNAAGITLALNFGNNSVGGTTRRMVSTGSSGAVLSYQLYQPSAATPGAPCSYPATTVWGDGTNGMVLTPRGTTWGNTPQVFNVCGTIPAGQDVEPGPSLDVITATINF